MSWRREIMDAPHQLIRGEEMQRSRLHRHFVSLIAGILILAALPASAEDAAQSLYRTEMLRAAPGQLASVIELVKERLPVWKQMYDAGPFWMRHSQGDQWDLLLLFPMGSDFEEYHGSSARKRRDTAAAKSGISETEFRRELLSRVAWREDLYVWGPSPEVVTSRFADAGFFHVEIFLALAGKRAELLEQREMENLYLAKIERPTNLIFTRAGGAAWDCYTIGFYRDIKHFAASADVPAEAEESAAIEAGFTSASTIGTYLRELISQHHDTLAVAVR
jgi:hypothetical protein